MRNSCITGSDLALRVVFGVASESNVLESANSRLDWLKQPLSSLKRFICGGVCFIFVNVAWKGEGRQNSL